METLHKVELELSEDSICKAFGILYGFMSCDPSKNEELRPVLMCLKDKMKVFMAPEDFEELFIKMNIEIFNVQKVIHAERTQSPSEN